MNDRRFYKPLLSLLVVALLVGVNFAQRQLTAERVRLKLTRVEAVEIAQGGGVRLVLLLVPPSRAVRPSRPAPRR
mgnify:CR=1 FL=1